MDEQSLEEYRVLAGVAASHELYERAQPLVPVEKALKALGQGAFVLGVARQAGAWVLRFEGKQGESVTDFKKLMAAPDAAWKLANPGISRWSEGQKRAFLMLRGARSVPSFA